MPGPAFDMPDAQDPQISCQCLSRLLTLLLNVSVSPVDSQGASLEGMANADWFFGVGAAMAPTKCVHFHCPYVQFCLQKIKSTQSPCSDRDLAKA